MTPNGLVEEHIGHLSQNYDGKFSIIAGHVRADALAREVAGSELKLAMLKRDLSNADVAKVMGVNPSTVGRWISGETIIPFNAFYYLTAKTPKIQFSYSYFTNKLSISFLSPFVITSELDCTHAPHITSLLAGIWRDSGVKFVILEAFVKALANSGVKESDILPFIHSEAKSLTINKKNFSGVALRRFCNIINGLDRYWEDKKGRDDECFQRRMRGDILDYLECFVASFQCGSEGDSDISGGEEPACADPANQGAVKW